MATRWMCTGCGRRFGRANQSHTCEPSMSVDDYFEDRPVSQRKTCAAVVRHLAKVGPTEVEAVGIGILFKRERTFAELRPKRDFLVLSVLLSRTIEHPRITRTLRASAHRVAHFVEVRAPSDIDRDVRAWLTEAYVASPSARRADA